MIVYAKTKQAFMGDILQGDIEDIIEAEYEKRIGRSPKSQINSWKSSLNYMFHVMYDPHIPEDAGVAIEYKIPTTSMRIDFLISGYNESHDDTVVIVELKQWSECERIPGMDDVVNVRYAHGMGKTSHPSYQAWSYENILENTNEAISATPIELHPCAFLHNYKPVENDPLTDRTTNHYLDQAPLFLEKDVRKLSSFISRYIHYGDNRKVLYTIENGKIAPSVSLQQNVSRLLSDNRKFFALIDSQKVVYEEALAEARESRRDHKKRVMIVKGGPGTGKSVVSLKLVYQLLAKDGMNTCYVTPNQSPRDCFTKQLKSDRYSTAAAINNLFKGSGAFENSQKDDYDVIVCDEAHRLKVRSQYQKSDVPQVEQIINTACMTVFFIDEEQRVTFKDVGSVDYIRKAARKYGAEVFIEELTSQFRCNGSDGYLAWLDNILEIRNTANEVFDFDYDFQVFDDPEKLRQVIVQKNKINNRSRMVAGYCWEWDNTGKNRNDTNHKDVVIPEYHFGMSWNLGNSSTTWAVNPDSVNEIGCIHTCQGLEFDYVGVIIGDDMRYENGHIVTDCTRRAKSDKSWNGLKKLYKTDPKKARKIESEIVKNTYRTLMTRGMKGCYVYCTDKPLADYLRKMSNIQK